MVRPRAAAQEPGYFAAAAFRRWLQQHHASAPEVLVGVHELRRPRAQAAGRDRRP